MCVAKLHFSTYIELLIEVVVDTCENTHREFTWKTSSLHINGTIWLTSIIVSLLLCLTPCCSKANLSTSKEINALITLEVVLITEINTKFTVRRCILR